ncbi:hypothetical protein [Filifactor villosus]|uniref:Uncharacterized protein n=1 Tax=Filifactor villosus TaxID=29374 RepID=A0ABV9QNV8_9FIRM
MKKYLITVTLIILLVAGIYHLIYTEGILYLPHKEDIKPSVNFHIEGSSIFHHGSVEDKKFLIRGVDIQSFTPGFEQTQYAIDRETYETWFSQISEMGANTLRVYSIMDADFYDALYAFNRSSDNPLYLLQGIRIDDYSANSETDALHPTFFEQLRLDARIAVDCIHGRKNIFTNRNGNGSGVYRKDVSKWVLGFIIGESWNNETIAYTDEENEYLPFSGTYFYTTEEATPFETVLAQVMEELVEYETEKYATQHLVSFISSPSNDPFTYKQNYCIQMSKFAQLNIEHVKATENVHAGIFASYEMYDFNGRFMHYLETDAPFFTPAFVKHLDTLSYPAAYSSLLCHYHSMPVVITGYGYSTSRGIDTTEFLGSTSPFSEERQGLLLVRTYKDFISSGCSGATIYAWQDNWDSSSWNTSFAVNKDFTHLWGDVQTNRQGFGLLTFENTQKNHSVDGKDEEWAIHSPIVSGAASLFVDYDEKFIYFKVEKKGLSMQDNIYIPLDTTPKSGSLRYPAANLVFDRDTDFILAIRGINDSELLVQKRYSAVRENYLAESLGNDPFIHIPDTASQSFETVSMVLKNNRVFDNLNKIKHKDKWLPLHPSGKLLHGTTDRKDELFNSQADFCYGKDILEIRIPWQLLNFSNPAQGMIHDDYYEYYGVSELSIPSFHAGLSISDAGQGIVSLHEVLLKNWRSPDVQPVLKHSYAIVKDSWTKEGD